MKNLTLNVKKKWFDMILSGVKKEEYREIKDFSVVRCLQMDSELGASFKEYDTVTFLNGMKTLTPTIVIECKGIIIGGAVPEWSDNMQGEMFVIKLGELISTKNINNNASTYI